MKKVKLSFSELIKKNKEELLKDKAQIEKIEKRIDDKYVKSNSSRF
ncbi:FbpB family small basic protein [Neobacillus sp. YIM B06451]|nr:FbpB family small basic protein [Neobacillus sp. YIM B06451]